MPTIVRSNWVSTSMAFETKCHKPLCNSDRTSVSISKMNYYEPLLRQEF